MARLKRYELYEGDGEIIPETYHPPEEKSKQPEQTQSAQVTETRRRYFARNEEDDGLGAPSSLFDDFDRFTGNTERQPLPEKSEPKHHNGIWIAEIILCLLLLTGMAVLAVPQLTGIRYKFLPNIGFLNGSIITLDEEREKTLNQCRAALYTDRIYPGVYIDNVHVGDMTRAEAVRAVESVNEKTDAAFDLLVSIGNESWHVNSERVPISRNIQETVEKAWAQGRNNTDSIRGSGVTPFQERVDQASRMRSYPVTYLTRQDYDHQALRTLAEGIVNYVNRDPVNSTVESFNFSTKVFTFTEDQPGASVDPEDLYARLTELLDNGVTQTTVRVVPEKIEAEMTKAELMNRFGQISEYTTNTTNNKNRNTNIQLSASAISGVTVMPGEVFSFNGATGERTAAKGYKEAAAISGGQSRDEIGGGVCQTSSTLFNAVARANLEIVERNPHAWPSNYVEKGFDATVNWPGLDFKFRNNTDWPVFIIAGYNNRKVTVTIYGMTLGPGIRIDLESEVTRTFAQPEGTNYVVNPSLAPGESKKTITGRKGYEVQTWKIWYQGNKETKRELLFTTTYKPYQETIEYNPR